MKKIFKLFSIILGMALLVAPMAGLSEECKESRNIAALQRYAFQGQNVHSDPGVYVYQVTVTGELDGTTTLTYGAVAWDVNDKSTTTLAVYIYGGGGEFMSTFTDPNRSVAVFGPVTPFGLLPIASVALDSCQTEEAAGEFLKFLKTLDYEANNFVPRGF